MTTTSSNHRPSHGAFTPEIQGLRAIAVLAVVIFHFCPSWLPGGFVGVDVFFVISGFLITGLLVREAERNGTVNLVNFYLRRIRRLLPAATLVLLTVAVLTPLLLPEERWEETATQVLTSFFYVENWRLAQMAVDYLAQGEAPSPLQHFWSLSVEEQFYIVWPGLVLLAALLMRNRGGRLRRVLLGAMAVLTAVSLAISLWLTDKEPASAYFVTQTRLWELGLGGLLATLELRATERLRLVAGLLGAAAIALACAVFSEKTPFPGYAALLPTFGAALVLFAGTSGARWSVHALLRLPPMQFVGDISYSLYLWHWPVLIFAHAMLGRKFAPVELVGLLLGTFVLSYASKVLVEDRFRHGETALILPRWAGISALVLPAVISGVMLGGIQLASFLAELPAAHPGALQLRGALVPPFAPPAPLLVKLKKDQPDAYARNCHLSISEVQPNPCTYGDPEGKTLVFIAGDSHAAQWIPALDLIGREHGWRIESYTKSACPFVLVTALRSKKPYTECLEFARLVQAEVLRRRPTLLIVSNSHYAYVEKGTALPALEAMWRNFVQSGTQILAIGDTPRRKEAPGECLSKHKSDCDEPFRPRKEPDLVLAAATALDLPQLDMNDQVCPKARCPAIIGNVIVWRDQHHLTATYSRSLAAALAERIDQALSDELLI